MNDFFDRWVMAAATSAGFFWMAFWAFGLGYLISSMIQVFLTRERMQEAIGDDGPRAMGLATFFGFISSSCSFAALSASRALFQRGAGLAPTLAFLLASTNLVVELGIVIAVFLTWHFVVAEYVGGLLLILVMWLVVRLTLTKKLEDSARDRARDSSAEPRSESPDWRELIRSRDGWTKIARQYGMEWAMVWKDVAVGFTAAGVIAAFVPASFFTSLFIGSGDPGGPTWWETVLHTLIGPVAAFFTFIGSMGNIPLAGLLFGSGVTFAGVMAFIFSDLVVFPMLRISVRYFGLRMAFYILGVFLVSIVAASLALHYGFQALDLLPDPAVGGPGRVAPEKRFKLDHTFGLNLLFVALSVAFYSLRRRGDEGSHGDHDDDPDVMSRVMTVAAYASAAWLAVGLLLWSVL